MDSVESWLKTAVARLKESGIGTVRLDALVLLEDVYGQDRGWLLAHGEARLSARQISILNKCIAQRTKHLPLAYIRGKTEFYGREFLVNKHVLEPRPESEAMIDILKKIVRGKAQSPARQNSKGVRIIDVGTGSGALAVTAKLELPEAEVTAIDIDPACLKVARQNSERLGAEGINFLSGNLLEPLHRAITSEQLTILLANLPYVPDDFKINPAAMNEPRLAIFGGRDGLDVYRKLFTQLSPPKMSKVIALTESLPPQHGQLVRIAADAGFKILEDTDFIQYFSKKV